MKKITSLVVMIAVLASIMSVCLAQVIAPVAPIAPIEPVYPANKSRVEYFATFLVVATFEGIEHNPGPAQPLIYPERNINVATFKIDKHLVYARYNEYGDSKSDVFGVIIDNGEGTSPLIDKALYDQIKDLKVGQKVLLSWDHLYVTDENGSKSPERPIRLLHPITNEQAAVMAEVPGPKPVNGVASTLDRYYIATANFAGLEKGLYKFIIADNLYTYHYNGIATLEFTFAFTVNPKTAHKSVLNQITKLKKNDLVLMGVRRDIVGHDLVLTPLFVVKTAAPVQPIQPL